MYSTVDFNKIREKNPVYDLICRGCEDAQLWIDAVDETAVTQKEFIDKIIDASPNFTYMYVPFDKDYANHLDKTVKNVIKGAVKKVYDTIAGVVKAKATLRVMGKSLVDSDYLYRQQIKDKYGFDPGCLTIMSFNRFVEDTVDDMLFFALDDMESNLFLKGDAAREEYLGGVLLDLVLALVYVQESSEAAYISSTDSTPYSIYNGTDSASKRVYELFEDTDGTYRILGELKGKQLPTTIYTPIDPNNYGVYSQLADTYGSGFQKFIISCSPYANDLIPLINNNSLQFSKLIQVVNYEAFAKGVSYFGNDYAKYMLEDILPYNNLPLDSINALDNHFDDFVKYSDKYGTNFVKVFSTYPQYADDIIKYTELRGKYFVKRVAEESQKGEGALKALLTRVSKQYNYSRYGTSFAHSNSFANRNLTTALNKADLSYDDFMRLRKINHQDPILTDEMIDKMKTIRNAIADPTENTLMSKVIPSSDVEKYLSGDYYQVGGFVTKADDVANCTKYMDYYTNLGLSYNGSKFLPNTDDYLGVIRFNSEAVNSLEIPYGIGFEGSIDDPLPFTGNGFAGGTATNCITPEYRFTSPANVLDGAELYIVTQDGDEILMAIYNKKALRPDGKPGRFVRLEDIGNE